jgi:hypothetical protein
MHATDQWGFWEWLGQTLRLVYVPKLSYYYYRACYNDHASLVASACFVKHSPNTGSLPRHARPAVTDGSLNNINRTETPRKSYEAGSCVDDTFVSKAEG